jgi:hypothetical protein
MTISSLASLAVGLFITCSLGLCLYVGATHGYLQADISPVRRARSGVLCGEARSADADDAPGRTIRRSIGNARRDPGRGNLSHRHDVPRI